ncbi:hypothetical protein O3M35_005606 [Rhynocoris fuscipes]|uniref:Uncharacterized protein n=1 Tax=Rhynocoris fuscipes TaxID=488301 RepID=A0AAW1DLH1_9HEMI
MNFTYGFPNCDYDVVLAEENDTVSCIDNKLMSDTVLGIKCIKDIDPFQFSVPPVNYLRKCCPINRGYDTSLQSCWSDRTEYHTGLPQDLVNILIPGYDGVVDIRTGSPICEPDEVLVDHLVPYSRVRREKSESIVIKLKEGLNETILNPDEACLDLTERHNILVLRVCQNEWTACRPRGRHTCIRKCCPDGESYVNHVCAPSTSVIKPLELYNFTADGSKIPVEHIRPALFYGDLCQDKYFLNPEEDPADEFSIGIDGLIHYAVGMLEYNYCIENTNSSEDGLQGDYVFVCFKDEEDPYSHKTFYSYIMIISCISLTITLVVYTCLPQLRNLHGKTLMCYVSCLLASYSCLVYVSLDELHSYVSCIVSAYVMQFFFLAAFSWLNVISFDIWWTFG